MAHVKISELPAAGTLDGTEALPIVQDTETVQSTIQDILDLGDTGTAINTDALAEIHGLTAKGTPIAADELLIEDSAAAWAKKRVALSALASLFALSDLDPTTIADQTWNGRKATMTAGENLVRGDVCYINSSSKLVKADADAASTTNSLFLALATIANNATGLFGVGPGFWRDDAYAAWTVGGTLYLSTTSGGITQTAPSGVDDVVQILGTAYAAKVIYFAPSPLILEHT